MPCTEKRARLLLERGRARVHRLIPFVIRLVDRQVEDSEFQPLRLKLDPGSKTTGLALVRDTEVLDLSTREIQTGVAVLNLLELVHRGKQISEALTARRQMRRRRRNQLRHRAPRFLNRGNKNSGWLAPSLQHRVDTCMAWVERIRRWAPVQAISSELVRFDMQALQNPEISGIEYQQGTLFGYEVREYLLEKWGRQCAYCDAKDVPLQIEHIHPKAQGGSNRSSNLTLACRCCNQKKSARSVQDFLAKDKKRLAHILAHAKAPLRDAAEAVDHRAEDLLARLRVTRSRPAVDLVEPLGDVRLQFLLRLLRPELLSARVERHLLVELIARVVRVPALQVQRPLRLAHLTAHAHPRSVLAAEPTGRTNVALTERPALSAVRRASVRESGSSLHHLLRT